MFGLKLNKYNSIRNFHRIEVVCSGSETQLQVGDSFNKIT